jgi:DeoR family ulaG and ulaABCDEF operon transcriptional repressor
MIERERHSAILGLLKDKPIVSVAELVAALDASAATVRRDIGALAARGELRRVRGGIEAMKPRAEARLAGTPFDENKAIAVAQKRAIGKAAAALVAPGANLIVNGGTTTLAMVDYMPRSGLNVLTNSMPIAARLLEASSNRVSLPGGTVFREQNIILSPFEADSVENFRAEIMFTGCFGISRFGMMDADPLIVKSELRLLRLADRLVVLADSRKLRKGGSMVVVGLERIATLVTDDGATAAELALFRDAGVEVIVAPMPRGARRD